MTRLREVIGDIDELVFVSDRAQSIKIAMFTIYERRKTMHVRGTLRRL